MFDISKKTILYKKGSLMYFKTFLLTLNLNKSAGSRQFDSTGKIKIEIKNICCRRRSFLKPDGWQNNYRNPQKCNKKFFLMIAEF